MPSDTMPSETMPSDTMPSDGGFDPLGLVPPRRLGDLLSRHRSDRGLTLEEVATSTHGRISLAGLAAIERGVAPLTDDSLRLLSDVYELDTVSLVPTRSRLVLDLDARYIAVEDHRTALPRRAPKRDDVLVRYLTMVYSMRGIDPGAPITLRVEDLAVLGAAFHEDTPTLATDLEALMTQSGDLVRRRLRLLDRRVLIPAAGVLVACFAAGSLLLIDRADESPGPTPERSSVVVVAPSGSVDIGTPMTQERGSTGIPATSAPDPGLVDDGAAHIIDPLVIERSDTGEDAPVISSTSQTR